MVTDRQDEETPARCVCLMVYWHDSSRGPRAEATTTARSAKVRHVARERDRDSTLRILGTVRSGLVDRYGPETGAWLNAEFLKAYGDGGCGDER